MIPSRPSSRFLLLVIAAVAALAVVAGVLGSSVGFAVAALVPPVLGELLWLHSWPPRGRLVRGFFVGLGMAALALAVLTASESPVALIAALVLMLASSVSYAVAVGPLVPWANFAVAAAIAGVLGGGVVAAMAFRGPIPVLVAGVLAAVAAAFMTVPATVLGRAATAGALLLTVPPAVVALHPTADTLDRPFLTALLLVCLLAGHTALTLGAIRAAEPVAKEREESPPLVSIWDHLRASA